MYWYFERVSWGRGLNERVAFSLSEWESGILREKDPGGGEKVGG